MLEQVLVQHLVGRVELLLALGSTPQSTTLTRLLTLAAVVVAALAEVALYLVVVQVEVLEQGV